MGEAQTNRDGEQTLTSAPSSGQSPQTSGAAAPGGNPRTFTPEQVDKLLSDRLAQAGREAKVLEARKAELETREKALQEREAKERERLQGNPEELSLFDRKRRLDAELRDFAARVKGHEEREASLTSRLKHAEEVEFGLAVAELAQETGVDAAALKETGIRDLAQLKKVAALLPHRGVNIRPDSGKTAGGAGFGSMSPQEKIRFGMEYPEAKMT